MKYIISESRLNKIIYKFLTSKFEPHEEKPSKNYPNSIFWVKGDEVIVEIQNSKKKNTSGPSQKIWVSAYIWDVTSDMFSLDYDETKLLITHWLEEHYELGGLTTTIKKANKYQWNGITL
jgi:hypothetical protein